MDAVRMAYLYARITEIWIEHEPAKEIHEHAL